MTMIVQDFERSRYKDVELKSGARRGQELFADKVNYFLRIQFVYVLEHISTNTNSRWILISCRVLDL